MGSQHGLWSEASPQQPNKQIGKFDQNKIRINVRSGGLFFYMQKRKKNVYLWESLYSCVHTHTHTLTHTRLGEMLDSSL